MATQPNRDGTFIWLTSSASESGGNCVEVARSESSVLVRDSADARGVILEFSLAHWRGFMRRIKNAKGIVSR
jgi:Domain of unknown function (DUF397)